MRRLVLLLSGALCLAALPCCPAQTAAARTHSKGNAEEGHTVYQHACVMCHSTQPGVKIVGPSLAGVLHGPHALTTHGVEQIILNGKGKMPPARSRVSDDDVVNLLAYLKTL